MEDAHDGMTNPDLASKRIWHGYSFRKASRMVEALLSAWLTLGRRRWGTEMSVGRAYEAGVGVSGERDGRFTATPLNALPWVPELNKKSLDIAHLVRPGYYVQAH